MGEKTIQNSQKQNFGPEINEKSEAKYYFANGGNTGSYNLTLHLLLKKII